MSGVQGGPRLDEGVGASLTTADDCQSTFDDWVATFFASESDSVLRLEVGATRHMAAVMSLMTFVDGDVTAATRDKAGATRHVARVDWLVKKVTAP